LAYFPAATSSTTLSLNASLYRTTSLIFLSPHDNFKPGRDIFSILHLSFSIPRRDGTAPVHGPKRHFGRPRFPGQRLRAIAGRCNFTNTQKINLFLKQNQLVLKYYKRRKKKRKKSDFIVFL
ncbi:MAG: hypothetical protein LBT00_10595, partial [Spirochaetaceae bacterium]|nr:hypothetical protein [Spirochaetaceae bacterium]